MAIGVTPNNNNANYMYKQNNFKYVLLSILFIFACFVIYLLSLNLFKPKEIISENISIENINVSGKTKDEAINILNSSFAYLKTDDAEFKIAETKFKLNAEELDYNLDILDAAEKAYDISKKNRFKKFKEPLNIPIESSYNIALMDLYLDKILKLIPNDSNREDLIKIEDNNLIIYKGNAPLKITKEELKNIILKKFKSTNFKQVEEIPLTSSKNKSIDLDKIYKDIEKDPKDAYIDENGQIVKEVIGYKLKLTKQEAQKLYNESTDKCIIPIETTAPKLTSNDLNKNIFPDKLSEYYLKAPKIYTSLPAKAQNISGIIVKNNTIFSYDKYQNNKSEVDSFIATGIYNCAMLLNLDILEMHKHEVLPDFLENGLDVDVTSKNFSFRNNLNSPIQINIILDNSGALFQIFGIKKGVKTDVKLTSLIKENIPFESETRKNFAFHIGYSNIVQKGKNQKTIEVYKEILINNKSAGKHLIGTYKYKKQNEIKEIGAKPSSFNPNNSNGNNNNNENENNNNNNNNND